MRLFGLQQSHSFVYFRKIFFFNNLLKIIFEWVVVAVLALENKDSNQFIYMQNSFILSVSSKIATENDSQ